MNPTDLFKSFSEPIRLRIMHLLGNTEPELCVCDLVAVLSVPQGTISRHLTHLRLVGLVKDRREGVWVYYRLAPPQTRLHAAMLQCLVDCLADDLMLAGDLKKYQSLKEAKTLACCTPQNLQGRVPLVKSLEKKVD